MELVSTKEVRETIKETIQTELLKRGFTAKIVEFEEVKGRSSTRFKFITEPFQTVPVLFKNIVVGEFSSGIKVDEEMTEKHGQKFYSFYIGVNVHYEHFDMGRNSSSLFSISGTFNLNDNRIYKLKIK